MILYNVLMSAYATTFFPRVLKIIDQSSRLIIMFGQNLITRIVAGVIEKCEKDKENVASSPA